MESYRILPMLDEVKLVLRQHNAPQSAIDYVQFAIDVLLREGGDANGSEE